MTIATMTQAQGLRQRIAETLCTLRALSIALYRAHGGWFA